MFANQSESHAIREDDLEDFGAEAEEEALELYHADVEETENDLLVPAADDDAGPESSLDRAPRSKSGEGRVTGGGGGWWR